MTTRLRMILAGAFVLAGCDDGPPSFGDPVDDPQVPPRGSEDVLTWIEAGHYQSWACEPVAHPPRGNGAHGTNRICSNDAIATSSGSGPFPVGAAAVKELIRDGSIGGYAVYLKVDEGEGGDTWYWFEGHRGDVPFNGIGESTCTSCHRGAPRDFVFTVVTR